MLPLKILAGASILAVVVTGCAADEPRDVMTTNPDLLEVRGEIVKHVDSGDLPSVSVAVALDGETVWQESFGWQDIENKIPATPSTIYAIGSVAKSMTATGVMVQVDAGNLRLDQPVNNVIGKDAIQSYAGSANEITLRDLLSMTAGIPHGWVGVQVKAHTKRPSLNQIVHDYAFAAYPPGEVFEYSATPSE